MKSLCAIRSCATDRAFGAGLCGLCTWPIGIHPHVHHVTLIGVSVGYYLQLRKSHLVRIVETNFAKRGMWKYEVSAG